MIWERVGDDGWRCGDYEIWTVSGGRSGRAGHAEVREVQLRFKGVVLSGCEDSMQVWEAKRAARLHSQGRSYV